MLPRESIVQTCSIRGSRANCWPHGQISQLSNLPPSANEIVEQCGNLPLALSVVGGMLRDASHKSWQDTLDLLRNADLSAIEDQLPEGQQSFFKAVEVSFQSLKPEMQERYKALAMLLEDMLAPLPILQALWSVSAAEARRISRILAIARSRNATAQTRAFVCTICNSITCAHNGQKRTRKL